MAEVDSGTRIVHRRRRAVAARLTFRAQIPAPEDLYDLRVPVEVALSPDCARVAFTVKSANPRLDGYRMAVWIVPLTARVRPVN